MLSRPRLVASGMLATTVLLTGACSGGAPAAPLETPPAGMQPYQAPPESVPEVRLGSKVLAPAMYAWRIGGTYRQVAPNSDDGVPSTKVPITSNSQLQFTVRTSVRPLQARIIVYANTTAAVPEGQGTIVDCVAGPDCTIQAASAALTLNLIRPVQPPAVVVVDVQYPTIEAADSAEGIASYGASWVVRLQSR